MITQRRTFVQLAFGMAVALVAANAQNTPAPPLIQTFVDSSGAPMSGALISTFTAGTSSPAVTYQDSSGTLNTNPIVADSAGRAQIWLAPNLLYKFSVANSLGVVQYVVDNVGGSGGGGSSSGQWTSSGINIYNSNMPGNVGIGCTSPLQLFSVCGASSGTNFPIRVDDATNTPGLNLYASGFKTGSWNADSGAALRIRSQSDTQQMVIGQSNQTTLPSSGLFCWSSSGDASGTADTCLARNAANTLEIDTGTAGTYASLVLKNLTVSGTCSGCGGGGGGSPGGPVNSVQYNNSGALGGSANLTYVSQLLTSIASSSSVAAIAAGTGYIQSDQGFLATAATCTKYNCFQAAAGGAAALSFTAANYVQTGNATTTPTLTTSDSFHAGAMYYDTTAMCEEVYNGSAWACLGGGSGTPGGSTNYIQFNFTGSLGGVAALQWCAAAAGACSATGYELVTATSSTSPALVGQTGYIQADAGFLVSVSTAYNAINVVGTGGGCATSSPCGGVAGRSGTFTTYVQTGTYAGALAGGPSATTSDSFHAGAISWSTVGGCEAVYNGSTWACISGSGVSGVSSITGTGSQVLANGTTGIAQTGAVTLTLPQNIATTSSPTFANVTSNGVFQSTLSTSGIAFQANGGTFQVNGLGDISGNGGINMAGASGSGAPYKVAGSAVINSSGAFVGTGGVNTTSGGTFGSSVTVTGNVTATGKLNSSVTGASIGLQSGSYFLVDGQGNVSTSCPSGGSGCGVIAIATSSTGSGGLNITGSNTQKNSIQTIGGVNVGSTGGSNGVYQVNGTTVINSSGQFIGPGANLGGNGIAALGYNVNNGSGSLIANGQTVTITIPSGFVIGGTTYHTLYFYGGILGTWM